MLSLYQTVSCNYTFQFQCSWSQQLYNSLSTICLAWERMCSPDCTRQRMANIWELNWVLEEFLILCPGPRGASGSMMRFPREEWNSAVKIFSSVFLFFPLFQKDFLNLFLRFALIQGIALHQQMTRSGVSCACGEICNSGENSCDFAIQMGDR